MKKITVLFLILIIGLVYYWYFIESQKQISDEQKRDIKINIFGRENRQEVVQAIWKDHKGKHFIMKYPDNSRIQENDTSASPGIMERFSFDTFSPRYTFTVSVMTKDDITTFDDISGVRLRRSRDHEYRENKTELGTHDVLHFSKVIDSAEETAYLISPSYVYSFSATKSNPSDEFTNFFFEVFSSVEILD